MMRCAEFVGVPGSGAGGSQPFRLLVAPAALVAMDFHAHLDANEVGGLLGGSFDEATATLRCVRMESGLHNIVYCNTRMPHMLMVPVVTRIHRQFDWSSMLYTQLAAFMHL